MMGSVSLCWIIPGSFDGSQELCPLLLALYRLQRNLRASWSNLRRPKAQNTGHGGEDRSTWCLPVRIGQTAQSKFFLYLHNLRYEGSNFVAQSTRTPGNTENRRVATLSEPHESSLIPYHRKMCRSGLQNSPQISVEHKRSGEICGSGMQLFASSKRGRTDGRWCVAWRKVNGGQDMEIVPCGTKRSARCRFLVGRSPRQGAIVTQALAQTFTSVESPIELEPSF
jgi:hypothetical protein